MQYFLWFAKYLARGIYFFLKWFPIQNKVVLISRFHEKTSIDFHLLHQEMKRIHPYTKIVILNHKLKKKPFLVFDVLREMYHLATSHSCIVDSYVIPVSILKHKKELIIIQIWHALGAIKKFGYASLEKKEGASQKTAKQMHMHHNYHYVIVSGTDTALFYREAFGTSEKTLTCIGMPRLDYLNDSLQKNKVRETIYSKYPNLLTKKNILYSPTFRKDEPIPYLQIIESVDLNQYNLIIKRHSLDQTQVPMTEGVIVDTHFDHIDMLFVADYVITDYSAIAFESAFLEIPTYFFIYDIHEYRRKRGLFIDLETEEWIPYVSTQIKIIMQWIHTDHYDKNLFVQFKQKYTIDSKGNSTKNIVALLDLKGRCYHETIFKKDNN